MQMKTLVAFLVLAIGLTQATRVRFFHASPDAPNVVDVFVNDAIQWSNITFGTLTPYSDLMGTQANFRVKVVNSDTTVLTFSVDLVDTPLTVAAIDQASRIKSVIFMDQSTVAPDTARVRILHLSPDAPAVTIRARVQGRTVTLVEGLEFGQATEYTDVPPQCLDVLVSPAAMPGLVIMEKRNVCLNGGTIYTASAIGMMSRLKIKVSEDVVLGTPSNDS